MATSARSNAARLNGAKSRGPKTAAGKKRSSINALRHGLVANLIVMPNEPLKNFEALLQQHVDRFNPVDDIEYGVIEDMTATMWRLRRLWAIESGLLAGRLELQPEDGTYNPLAGAFSELASGPEFPLLDRYESRLHRMYQRSLQNLELMRKMAADDQEAEPSPEPEPGNIEAGSFAPEEPPSAPPAAPEIAAAPPAALVPEVGPDPIEAPVADCGQNQKESVACPVASPDHANQDDTESADEEGQIFETNPTVLLRVPSFFSDRFQFSPVSQQSPPHWRK